MYPTMLNPRGGGRSNPPAEYKFRCHKSMFGELYGEALAPTRCAENRVYLSLQVHMSGDRVPYLYRLSVGHNEVQQILVHFGTVPSFVAIETSPRFAEVACQRIGKEVLVPGSPDPKKRYIILALSSAFYSEAEANLELSHLRSCITPWAKLRMLSEHQAHRLIADANLDVEQSSVSYINTGSKVYQRAFDFVETVLLYIPQCACAGIPVTTRDVMSLSEGAHLNDIIIDFYMQYIHDTILTPLQRQKTYIFNSYFYRKLTKRKRGKKPTPAAMHGMVRKWTQNVDIFDMNYIVVPINEKEHWYVAVICFPGWSRSVDFGDYQINLNDCNNVVAREMTLNDFHDDNDNDEDSSSAKVAKQQLKDSDKVAAASRQQQRGQAFDLNFFVQPCILIFEPRPRTTHPEVFANLRSYLTQEWTARKRVLRNRRKKIFNKLNMKACYPKIPEQDNDYDGGIFLLQNVEKFFTNPIKNFQTPIHLESWYGKEDIAVKRQNISNVIQELAEKKKN